MMQIEYSIADDGDNNGDDNGNGNGEGSDKNNNIGANDSSEVYFN